MATSNKINVQDIAVGDVFSEESHYVYIGKNPNNPAQFQFKHLESKQVINLDEKYVSELLTTADQYENEAEVGKEDKYWTKKQIEDAIKKGDLPADTKVREGDVRVKGIRSIWADIYSSQVFQVCFNKQDKNLSDKAVKTARDKQLQEVLALLNPQQPAAPVTRKRGRPAKNAPVANASQQAITVEEALRKIQENPILDYVPGEERELRGYKVQFSSVNGIYDVVDMDIVDGDPIRKVNVNTINWLIINNTKYIVK